MKKFIVIMVLIIVFFICFSGCATIMHPDRIGQKSSGLSYDWKASILNLFFTPVLLDEEGNIIAVIPIWHTIDFLTGAAWKE